MVTITYDQILLIAKIVPFLTLAYIVFKCKPNAKFIKNASITVVTLTALIMTTVNWMKETPQQRENRVITEQKAQESLENDLPGKWGKFYKVMMSFGNYNQRFSSLSGMVDSKIEETLPLEGFQRILENNHSTYTEQIIKLLTPYLFKNETTKTEILVKNETQ